MAERGRTKKGAFPMIAKKNQGKFTNWVKRNMPGVPVKFGFKADGKARFAGPNKILIDDREENISAWKAAGGIGILFKSTEQVKNELSKLGL